MRFSLTHNGVRDTWFIRRNGYLFVIHRSFNLSEDGKIKDYMIVDRLGKHPRGFLVAPVDPSIHTLVSHSGFVRDPDDSKVSAYVIDPGSLAGSVLTPGSVSHFVRITCNAKAGIGAPIDTYPQLESILRSDRFNPAALVENPAAGPGQPKAWYTQQVLSPKPGSCYMNVKNCEACGLPSPEETYL